MPLINIYLSSVTSSLLQSIWPKASVIDSLKISRQSWVIILQLHQYRYQCIVISIGACKVQPIFYTFEKVIATQGHHCSSNYGYSLVNVQLLLPLFHKMQLSPYNCHKLSCPSPSCEAFSACAGFTHTVWQALYMCNKP